MQTGPACPCNEESFINFYVEVEKPATVAMTHSQVAYAACGLMNNGHVYITRTYCKYWTIDATVTRGCNHAVSPWVN